MSRNVEIVREYLKGRYATTEVWDPNGDYYPVPKFPESRPCHGPKEIARFFRDFEQAWDHVQITTESISAVRDDRVLVIIAGEGRNGGLTLESEIFYLLLAPARPDILGGRPPHAGGRAPRTRPPRENA